MEVKERPIIFSTDMIKAILDGSKSQTRRVIKPQPKRGVICKCPGDNKTFSNYEMYLEYRRTGWIPIGKGFLCPYGQVGDRLWVRETCKIMDFGDTKGVVAFKTITNSPPETVSIKWTPSIFMPRWASRIDKIITLLRVERLLDISEEDAKAEGFNCEGSSTSTKPPNSR